jgi:ABC-type multidrug transport system fused ATPase/permease subunit
MARATVRFLALLPLPPPLCVVLVPPGRRPHPCGRRHPANDSCYDDSVLLSHLPIKSKFLSSYKPLQPSLTLLFSLMSRRDMFCFFLPAVLVSLISGGVAPFMTIAVGQVFDAFAKFPLSNPTQEDKDKLMRGVGISALTLLGLAVAALVLSSITSSLWIATGERNLRALRRRAYHVISNKEMVWFDKKLGSDDSMKATDGEDGPIGAGGMMAQFVKYAYFHSRILAAKFLTFV